MAETDQRDQLYREVVDAYGAALARLASAYEADPDRRRDLLQEIHVALWLSFAGFDGDCSLRTWVYRVAHNAAASHVRYERRRAATFVDLETLAETGDGSDHAGTLDRRMAAERLGRLIRRLRPIDRQVIVSYLEGLDAAAIGEIAGLSPGAVATRIHRIKTALAKRFHDGEGHER